VTRERTTADDVALALARLKVRLQALGRQDVADRLELVAGAAAAGRAWRLYERADGSGRMPALGLSDGYLGTSARAAVDTLRHVTAGLDVALDHDGRGWPHQSRRSDAGFGLIELLITITVGSMVALALTSLLLTTFRAQATLDRRIATSTAAVVSALRVASAPYDPACGYSLPDQAPVSVTLACSADSVTVTATHDSGGAPVVVVVPKVAP
jgi:prepilin-type N-terminal cleavage/methylation domain-containing protein